MPAADLDGLQAYIKELDQDAIDSNGDLLKSVVARLGGGQLELQSRHKVMDLGQGARVHLTVAGGRPCMVLTLLLHAFGIKAAQNYTEKKLIPYFQRVGVRVASCSSASLSSASPQGEPVDKYPREPEDAVEAEQANLSSGSPQGELVDKYLTTPVQDYERALASRSQGLLLRALQESDGSSHFPSHFLAVLARRTAQGGRSSSTRGWTREQWLSTTLIKSRTEMYAA